MRLRCLKETGRTSYSFNKEKTVRSFIECSYKKKSSNIFTINRFAIEAKSSDEPLAFLIQPLIKI